MPEAADLEVIVLLALIPTVIAAMYSLVRLTEDMRRKRPSGLWRSQS